MVSKKKALWIAGGSALIVGVVHFLAHKIFMGNPNVVTYVGLTVVVTVFIIGYFGMVSK